MCKVLTISISDVKLPCKRTDNQATVHKSASMQDGVEELPPVDKHDPDDGHGENDLELGHESSPRTLQSRSTLGTFFYADVKMFDTYTVVVSY